MGAENTKRLLTLYALINKAMEQLDVLINTDNNSRYEHWQNNLYTISEDLEDVFLEQNNEKQKETV